MHQRIQICCDLINSSVSLLTVLGVVLNLKMDLEQTVAALLSKNDQLDQENNLCKLMLSVIQENVNLRARMQSSHNETLEDATEGHPSSLLQNTIQRQFRKDLQQNRSAHDQRTSSPVDFKSFIQNSVLMDSTEKEFQSCPADFPPEVKEPERLIGEIAYQLDKRILAHVFQGHKRLYGFTLLNIPEKITEVSTHPLTGKLDEGYQLHLTQRYTDLMESLSQFGYKAALHPRFTELIVNAYGILKERPGEIITKNIDYNNPDFLKKLIMTTAPGKLQKDLLLVLTCLCSMAEKDKKPLLLWLT